jgi:8-oxo-dGTP pyrophosphatase MutT (NUDIX family)
MQSFQDRLMRVISDNLPGEKAHLKMAPLNRPLTSLALQNISNYSESAVAVLIFESNNDYSLNLIQRPYYDGVHSGQISFPGGKKDESDLDLIFTSIRECREEIGVDLTDAKLLGKLTPVFIPVSNFLVEPFVYFYPNLPIYKPDEREVESIITISIQELLDESNVSTMDIFLKDGLKINHVPCFDIQNKKIWGATALILNELKEVLRYL